MRVSTHTAGGEPRAPRIWVTSALAATIAALLVVGTVQVVRADLRDKPDTVEARSDPSENPDPVEARADPPEQTNPLPEGQERVQAYIEGSREHDYHAADGRFRARFPGPPIREEEELPSDVAGFQATMVSFFSETSEYLIFGVSYADMPAGSPFDFHGAINGAAVGTGGRLESAATTSHDGHGAIEGLIRAEELFIRTRIVKVADRMYVVQVIGLSDPQEAFGEFVSTVRFELLEG